MNNNVFQNDSATALGETKEEKIPMIPITDEINANVFSGDDHKTVGPNQ